MRSHWEHNYHDRKKTTAALSFILITAVHINHRQLFNVVQSHVITYLIHILNIARLFAIHLH